MKLMHPLNRPDPSKSGLYSDQQTKLQILYYVELFVVCLNLFNLENVQSKKMNRRFHLLWLFSVKCGMVVCSM